MNSDRVQLTSAEQEPGEALKDLLEQAGHVLSQTWVYTAQETVSCLYVGDVNSDGHVELILGTHGGWLKTLDGQGHVLSEAQVVENEHVTNLALGDVDADGTIEVLVGTSRGTICALEANGSRLWSANVDQWVDSVSFLTGNGSANREVMVGTENGTLFFLNRFGEVTDEVNTSHTVLAMPTHDPAQAPSGLFLGTRDGVIYLADEMGRERWVYTVDGWVYRLHLASLETSQVLLLAGLQNGDLVALDLEGRFLWKRVLGGWISGVSSADVDGDGQIEIVATTRNGYLYILDKGGNLRWLWDLEGVIVTMACLPFPGQTGQIVVAMEDGQLAAFGMAGLRVGMLKEIEELARQPGALAMLSNADQAVLASLGISVGTVDLDRTIPFAMLNAVLHDPSQLDEMLARSLLAQVTACPLARLWSRQVSAKIDTIDRVLASDGQAVLVVGAVDGSVSCWGTDSELRWRWLTVPGNWVWAARTGDLNSDGQSEIALGTKGGKLHVLSHQGKPLAWHELPRGIRALTLADVDGDGRIEFILGCEDSTLYVLGPDGGLKWRFVTGGWIRSVAVADMDGDGRPEVVAGARNGIAYVLDSSGQLRSSYDTGNWVRVVCPYDVDGDGHMELVLGCDNGKVYTLSHDLVVRWTFDAHYRIEAIRPLEVDGEVQLLVGSESQVLYSLTARGEVAWTVETMGWLRDILVADLDDDGRAEVVLSIFSSGGSRRNTRSYLQVWKVMDKADRNRLSKLCLEVLQSHAPVLQQ